tara:strand:- start:3723 stop:4157 length:435 start_codon:yes stop_codon:yes gene_type:complete
MTQIHPLKIGVEEYKEPEIICNFKELAEDEWSKDELLDIIGKMYDHCKTMKQDIAETKFYGGLISISFTYSSNWDEVRIEFKKFQETQRVSPACHEDVEYSGGLRGQTAQYAPQGATLKCQVLSTCYTPSSKERCLLWMSSKIR